MKKKSHNEISFYVVEKHLYLGKHRVKHLEKDMQMHRYPNPVNYKCRYKWTRPIKVATYGGRGVAAAAPSVGVGREWGGRAKRLVKCNYIIIISTRSDVIDRIPVIWLNRAPAGFPSDASRIPVRAFRVRRRQRRHFFPPPPTRDRPS